MALADSSGPVLAHLLQPDNPVAHWVPLRDPDPWSDGVGLSLVPELAPALGRVDRCPSDVGGGWQPKTARQDPGDVVLMAALRDIDAKGNLHMSSTNQHAKAVALRDLHKNGVLVLPNAWDAGSAALIAAAGAKAIATSSAGVAWALGRPDGEQLTREEMVAVIERVAATVDVPVTADIERGYGSGPEAVAETVRAVIAAGAVGINLEDSRAAGMLFEPETQAARIRAARAAASDAGLPELFINARTDVFLHGIGASEGRFDDVLNRGAVYAAAGADGLFVPGLGDLGVLASLTSKVSVPVNVMAGPGAPEIAAFARAGVRRVSLGPAIARAAYTMARKAAVEALSAGTYESVSGADGYADINRVFRAR